MRMKRIQAIFCIGLTAVMLISGCGKEEPYVSEPPAPATEGKTSEPPEDIEDTDNHNDTDPGSTTVTDIPPKAGMVRSLMTNEWIDEEIAQTRPIAITIPNTKNASQYGLSQAAILYECNVEGTLTRLMGIWDDWDNLEKIGNIRSTRDYFLYWAFEWDALYIHYGGPFYVDSLLTRKDTQTINCLRYSPASYFANAKNTTDNAFTGTEYIEDAIEYYDYPLTYREDFIDENHYLFAPSSAPNTLNQYPHAISAKEVDLSPAYPLTNCYFIYNPDTGLYERYQHLSGEKDGPHIDLANNEQLAFKNLLIQNTYFEVRDSNGFLAYQCHDTTRDGWFFTNGKGIHVTWEKTSDYGATRYYDDMGREIQLNTGKTMICIIQDGDNFMVDNVKR